MVVISVPPASAVVPLPNTNNPDEDTTEKFDDVPFSLPDNIKTSPEVESTLADIANPCNEPLLLILSLKLLRELPVVEPEAIYISVELLLYTEPLINTKSTPPIVNS